MDEVATDKDLALFLRGYSCAIGPIRTADPNEMSNALTAAIVVLHVGFEDAATMWMLIAEEAIEFLVENAEHIRMHHPEGVNTDAAHDATTSE